MDQGILLSGPDRSVPFESRLRLLFGGFLNQFGWAWFGFSMIHFRVFLFGGAPKGAVPWPLYLVLVGFPAIGLTFMGIGIRKGLRGIRLLRYGMVAKGLLASTKPTNTRINNQTVYELTFRFVAADGKEYTSVASTHETRPLQDETEEPLLYEPKDPTVSVMLDDLPGRPRLDDSSVTHTTGGSILPLLAVPGVVVFVHGTWLAWQILVR